MAALGRAMYGIADTRSMLLLSLSVASLHLSSSLPFGVSSLRSVSGRLQPIDQKSQFDESWELLSNTTSFLEITDTASPDTNSSTPVPER